MKLIYKILDQNGMLVSTGTYIAKQNS
jgi:hypothetical protein